VPRAGLEPTSKNANRWNGFDKKPQKKPQSEPHAAFCQRLQAAGFDAEQLLKISDALQQCGLEIVATEPDIG